MATNYFNPAPGKPGLPPMWSPGGKTGVGTAINEHSNVWFSLSHGIVNEVYFPRVDTASIRDMGLIISDGNGYFSEEKTDTNSVVSWFEPGVPGFRLTNTAKNGKYKITKQVITDPNRDSLLVSHTFTVLEEGLKLNLYNLLAPHLANQGYGNSAWVEEKDGQLTLLAQREDCVLACLCNYPFLQASAGYVGLSDGWQDIKQHKILTNQYSLAKDGNVALVSQIDLAKSHEFVISIGFGSDRAEAISNARASLEVGFTDLKKQYIAEWQDWHQKSNKNKLKLSDFALNSVAVLKVHQSKNPRGGIVAGLAVPWGEARSDDDSIGYHIVWTRDMVEVASGLLAVGYDLDIHSIISFLQFSQCSDGHWPQNMWLNGDPYWQGIQMDETALPILLINYAHKLKSIKNTDIIDYWAMIKKAAGYILRNGPVTQQDRWEEDPGYTPFTLSAEIAALLAAADFAELNNEFSLAKYMRQTADNWYEAIDRWMYVEHSDWSKQYKLNGYYERIVPVDNSQIVNRNNQTVHIKNVPPEQAYEAVTHLISPDCLALVRFGLRRADDSRITDSVCLIDSFLKLETDYGQSWHRYNGDGYGEQADGSAFNGTGVGRAWPLLTGERGLYELAKHNTNGAKQLLSDMEAFANQSNLLPEQIWDSQDIDKYELKYGRPSGSAMPLAWAHAEYLKLEVSIMNGSVCDTPEQTINRYLDKSTVSKYRSWRFNHKIKSINYGKILRIEVLSPALVRWSANNWQTYQDQETKDTGVGLFYADLQVDKLKADSEICFTFFWQHSQSWQQINFAVKVVS